jgi:hypothetical protein
MSNVVLHIGMPKTATTFLQRNVYRRHSDIESLRRLAGRDDSPENLHIFNLNSLSDDKFDPVATRYFYQQRIQNSSRKCQLLSWEDLSQSKARVTYQQKAERLFSVFGNSLFLVTIRNPLPLTYSLYSQWLRGVSKPNSSRTYMKYNSWLKRHLKKIGRGEPSELMKLMQGDVVNAYAKFFGEGNARIFLYEQLVADKNAFGRNMAAAMGVDPDQFVQLMGNRPVHQRLSVPHIKFIKHFKRPQSKQKPFDNLLKTYLRQLPEDWRTAVVDEMQGHDLRSPDEVIYWLSKFLFSYFDKARRPDIEEIEPEHEKDLLALTTPGLRAIAERFSLPLKDYGYDL